MSLETTTYGALVTTDISAEPGRKGMVWLDIRKCDKLLVGPKRGDAGFKA